MSDYERIYLQTVEVSSTEYEGRTWCQDRIDDTDTEYVRADLLADLRSQRDALKATVRDLQAIVYAGKAPEQAQSATEDRISRGADCAPESIEGE